MYNFDKAVDRSQSSSIKWNIQYGFGQRNGLIPFWIADLEFAVEPRIIKAIKERLEHPIIGYTYYPDDVYQAIQSWWSRRHGWTPDIASMFLSESVVTAIYLVLSCVVPQGEKVLTFTPVYDPFFAAIEKSGHTIVDCPLKEEDHYYSIDFERFEKELQKGVKAVLFCNPHNPVARVWKEDEICELVRLCAKYDVYLLSDEVHSDFAFARPYTTVGKYEHVHDKLILFTAISKTFNLAGLVSSCVTIPNQELKKQVLNYFESRWVFGPNELASVAIKAAYTYGDQWVDELREYIKSNAELVKEFVKEHMPKAVVTEHEGTFLMWIDLACLKMSSADIVGTLASEYGIAVGNGAPYGKQADGYVRLNIACTKEMLKHGLEQMSKMYRLYVN